jgi:hypothetical protein
VAYNAGCTHHLFPVHTLAVPAAGYLANSHYYFDFDILAVESFVEDSFVEDSFLDLLDSFVLGSSADSHSPPIIEQS